MLRPEIFTVLDYIRLNKEPFALEYSKKISFILALRLVWNIPFEVFHDGQTSLF
jgi:hypothetical protein